MMCVTLGPPADGAGEVYLATFVFRASKDAAGTFSVSLRSGDGTMAGDASGQEIEENFIGRAEIVVTGASGE